MESVYTQNVIDDFNKNFKDQWIEEFDWTSSKKHKEQAYAKGAQMISYFKQNLVVQYSKLVLSGDYIVNETKTLDDLQDVINSKLEDIVPEKSLKYELSCIFQDMLNDIATSIRVIKNHIALTKKRFQPNNLVISLNLISYNKYRPHEFKILT